MADFGAALTTADEAALQAVLEEMNVSTVVLCTSLYCILTPLLQPQVEKRLELALLLVKKELELSKLQVENNSSGF